MITIPIEDCNTFSQKSYDDYIKSLDIRMMKCKCGHCGCLTFYGHYTRCLKLLGLCITLSIWRVKCSSCGRTHALIPSLIVPYSQIPRQDQQEILASYDEGKSVNPVLERNCGIDESHVRHIIRRFKYFWKERIHALCLTLHDQLSEKCLSVFSLQFMQIHKTWNSFFCPPT